MAVGLVGILKAGGAHIALDPTYPTSHITHVMKNSPIKVVLTRRALVMQLPEHTVQVICFEEIEEASLANGDPLTLLPNRTTLDNLAFCSLYSGSTGEPKGVAVAQRQLYNRFKWNWGCYPFEQMRLCVSAPP